VSKSSLPLPMARRKLALYRHDYDCQGSLSALTDHTPVEFRAQYSGGKEGDQAGLENVAVSRFPSTRRQLRFL